MARFLHGPITILTVVGAILAAPLAFACTTPVHRYAMYNWEPSTYLVCYFFDGEEDAADRDVNVALRTMSESETSIVNITYQPVDIRDTALLEDAPAPVRSAWDDHRDKSLPLHMVFSPRGVLLHVGRMTRDDVARMTDSPWRKRLARLLGESRHGALLFLPGVDEEKNAAARVEVEKAIRLAAERVTVMDPSPSVLPGGDPRPKPADDASGDEGSDDAKPDFDLEVLELPRDDESESWLVRQLHAVERLDDEEVRLPMVFGVYGRGRALEPYLGAGIIAENMLEMISFMNGPCSCEVKDQNPGVDLLVTWDWENSARQLARRVGRETGNELLLEEIGLGYRELEIDAPPPGVAAAEPDDLPGGAAEPSSAVSTATEIEPADAPSPRDRAGSGEREAGSAGFLMIVLIPALGLGALALAAATVFLLMRRR